MKIFLVAPNDESLKIIVGLSSLTSDATFARVPSRARCAPNPAG